MRSVETLIKLAKHKVESVKKLIMAAQKIESDLVRQLHDLEERAAQEKRVVELNHEYISAYNMFKKSYELQKANVLASLDGVKEQLNSLDGDLRTAFEEQKKFETLHERRLQHAEDQRKARELKSMDEFAITRRRA